MLLHRYPPSTGIVTPLTNPDAASLDRKIQTPTSSSGSPNRLKGVRDSTSLPHERIIKRLDEAGQTFHILLIKTDLTLPYTSVFIQLQAGYWSDEAEHRLRDAMKLREERKERGETSQ